MASLRVYERRWIEARRLLTRCDTHGRGLERLGNKRRERPEISTRAVEPLEFEDPDRDIQLSAFKAAVVSTSLMSVGRT